MHIITAEFHRLVDIPLGDVLDEIGVYVIWDSQAVARPTYIGEGNILKRLVEHVGRFANPLDGHVAILAGSTWQRTKADAEIVEAMLLDIAQETDRAPSTNIAPGKLRSLDGIFRMHGTVRVNVRGFDPLVPPENARSLSKAKQITLRDFGDDIDIEDDWRLRRIRS